MVALPANHLPSISRPLPARAGCSLLPWLACLLLTLLVPAALRAATYTLPGTNITLTYTVSGTPATATITDCNADATGALVIPATLGGANVTSIGSIAFYGCTSLTSVTYTVQTATDLTNNSWTAAGVTQGTADGSGLTTASVPLDGPRYLRLSVTLNP
jgi:hypothetical protein